VGKSDRPGMRAICKGGVPSEKKRRRSDAFPEGHENCAFSSRGAPWEEGGKNVQLGGEVWIPGGWGGLGEGLFSFFCMERLSTERTFPGGNGLREDGERLLKKRGGVSRPLIKGRRN